MSPSWCPSGSHSLGQLEHTQKVSTYQVHQDALPTFAPSLRTQNILQETSWRRPPLKHKGPTHLQEVQLWDHVTRPPAIANTELRQTAHAIPTRESELLSWGPSAGPRVRARATACSPGRVTLTDLKRRAGRQEREGEWPGGRKELLEGGGGGGQPAGCETPMLPSGIANRG